MISRATVYNRFGSKSGLVDALIADSMTRSGIDQVVRAREAADAFDAVRRYIPEVCRFWESDFAVWRNLMYFSGLDSDAGQVGEKYDVMRREGVAFLVARLRDAGYLRRGISATHAEHALWTLTDFHIYDHLRHQCGMPVGEVAGALWSMASYLFVER